MAIDFIERLHVTELDSIRIEGVDLTNDGSRIAVAYVRSGKGSGIAVLRCDDEQIEANLDAPRMGRNVAFSADGQGLYWLADRDDATLIELCHVNLSNGISRSIATYTRHPNTHGLIRDRTGRFLAVVGNFVEVWDLESGKIVRFREASTAQTRAQATFNAQGTHLYMAGITPGLIECLEIETDQIVASWAALSSNEVANIALSRNEEYLVASSAGLNGVIAYDLKGGNRILPDIYNERTFTNTFVFVGASSVILAPELTLEATDLLSGKLSTGPKMPRGPATAAATAWDAPVVAFALQSQLCWIRISEK